MKINRIAENSETDKKIITFRIKREVKEQLKNVLINSREYNQKMKSDWVNEAIEMLTKNPSFKTLVLYADDSNTDDYVFDKVYMSFEQRCYFAEIRNKIVVEHPDIKGPQAAIIRAAITSRLFRDT